MHKKKTKYDFLAINRRMNGNWNGGDCVFTGPTKNISHGEEMKLNRKIKKDTKK